MKTKSDEEIDLITEPDIVLFWNGGLGDYELCQRIYRLAEQQSQAEIAELRNDKAMLVQQHNAMMVEIQSLQDTNSYSFNLGKEVAIEKAELLSVVFATMVKYDELNGMDDISDKVKAFHEQMESLRKEMEKQSKD